MDFCVAFIGDKYFDMKVISPSRVRGVVAQELRKVSLLFNGIFFDSKLNVLREHLTELLTVLFVFCQLRDDLKSLLYNVFVDDFPGFALLEHFLGDVHSWNQPHNR
jgi:hypothetical protein